MARFLPKLFCVLTLMILIGCGDGSDEPNGPVLRVVGVFATEIAEPWNSVVHGALLEAQNDGEITYTYRAGVGYAAGAMEDTLRELIATEGPDIIFGDSFGNEAATRKVALDYPEIAFAMGSAESETSPNFSVFDNWIHEPAYLSGMLAGGLTKADTLGIVGGYPVAEVNRLVNAFTAGARAVNPNVRVFVTYLSSWYDLDAASAATVEQIALGADIFFGERDGVIQAAASNQFLSFGNITDQRSIAPAQVVTSNLWNMRPTVDEVLADVRSGTYRAANLRDASMMLAGGAALAPINTKVQGGIPPELLSRVLLTLSTIRAGAFIVPIDESVPVDAIVQ